MKIVIARLNHETNSFSPVPTPLVAFGAGDGIGPRYGRDASEATRGARVGMSAMIAAAQARGCEIVTPLDATANPSGPVDAAAYTHLVKTIVDAVAQGCDAVLLDLHGAMVAENSVDGEGDLLEKIRAVAPRVPVSVALDLHGNISPKMVKHADIIVGFKTYPHIDMFETGAHAARLLFEMLDGRIKPVMALAHSRVLAQTLCMNTNEGAMKEAIAGACARERDPGILACSVFGGFGLADTPEAGASVVVVADGDAALAKRTARWGADFIFSRREEFVFNSRTVAESLTEAASVKRGPVILFDHGDNCMSGGTCDVTEVLEAALGRGLRSILAGPIADRECVAQMHAAGVGARVKLKLGNKLKSARVRRATPLPFEIEGVVRAVSDGAYVVSGPIYTGSTLHMGPSALLEFSGGQVVISSEPHEPLDLGCFSSLGVDVMHFHTWILKSRMYFRPVFAPLANAVIDCAGGGVTSSDNALFDFTQVRRPLYPLDA